MDNSSYLFEKEDITKAMTKLALPAVLVSLIGLIHELIHSVFIAQLNNTAMLSSTSLSMTLVTIIMKVGEAIGIGASTHLGREMGAKNDSKAKEIVRTAVTLDVIIGLVLTAVCLVIMVPFLRWQSNNNEEVLQYAIPFGYIAVSTAIFTGLQTTLISLFRSVGDIKFPVWAMGLNVVMMLVLDPLFMFGLKLGIVGAGISTALAGIVSCLICFNRLLKHRTMLEWKLFDFHVDRAVARAIFSVGISVYIRNFMSSFSISVYNKQVFQYGTDFAAGCNVGKYAMYFVNFFIQGVANGFLPLASYNYGARNYPRLYKALVWNLEVLTGYCVLAILFTSFFAEGFIGMFTKSPQAIVYGARYLRAYNWSLPIYSLYYIITSTLQAAGMGKQSMVLSLSRQGLIYTPLLLIMPRLWGENGIFMSQPVADWLTVIVGLIISAGLIREIWNGNKAMLSE